LTDPAGAEALSLPDPDPQAASTSSGRAAKRGKIFMYYSLGKSQTPAAASNGCNAAQS